MLRGYQEDMIGRVETAWATGQHNIIGVLPTGAGKCLGRGTPVLMYDGSIKAVEDVRVGDLLMGPDSQPRKVLSLARGREELYEVIPTKGDSYVVNASHILSLKRTAEKADPKYPCQKRAGEVVNISVTDYLASSKWFRHVHKGWRTGVEFGSAEIDGRLPPYLLGVWLGDGTSRDTSITTADPEIESTIRAYGAEHDVPVVLGGVSGQAKTWRLTRSNRWKGNPFLVALQRYGLLQNKHVPALYLRNNRKVRLEVLAGIIDSDGYLGNGYYDLIFKSDKLAGDVLYLARSLGFAAYSKRCFKRATNSAHAGDFYNRISISGSISEIPTRLARHAPAVRAQKKNVLVTGIQLKSLGVGDYFGFEIDGDRLFLLGDFTVTHNTMTMSAIAARHANEAGVTIAHRSVLIGQISIALARAGVPHDIIASKAVVRTIVTEHMEELGRSYYVPGARWKVASVDTLPGRAPALSAWIKQVTIGFTDECFPAGTLVDGVPIEHIRVGDMVTAFDEHTGKFSKRKVMRVFKNPMPATMCRVEAGGHHVLESTNGHPYWTQRGWVCAAELIPGDMILELHTVRETSGESDRSRHVSLAEKRDSVLQQVLRLPLSGQPEEVAAREVGAGDVCCLREAVRGEGCEAIEQTPGLLEGLLHGDTRKNIVSDHGGDESRTCVEADARTQSNAGRGNEGEDAGNSAGDETQACCAGREWQTPDASRSTVAFDNLANRVRHATCREDEGVSGCASPLQDRSGAPAIENCSRNRWGESFCREVQGAGREEGHISTWRRVDRVSFYEPSSADGQHVYNIEVDALHTYVANGIVVHNCHHVLADNKWGRECLRFDNPAMRWFLPTATPERGDRKGLGRQADGIADLIVEGPSMRWHIDNGYLTDYIIRAPMPADLDLSDVEIGANGEYNQKQVRRAVKRSTKIIGNVVDTYKMHTPGRLGIAFAVDIEHATALTKEFNDKGVPCELITAEHSEEERRSILRRYRNRETLVLVNVDLFGEGFDLPAIEVVMFVRPTNSYSLYAQQFGRGLRLMIEKAFMAMWESYTPEQRKAIIRQSGKPVAHIHDHVGNVLHFYGPPDKPREWSLERQASRRTTPSDAIPLRVCTNTMCLQPYERFYPRCPYCGMEPPVPPAPTLPQEVDGDLTLYTPEMLRKLFGVEAMEQALELQPDEFCAIPPNIPATAVRAIQAKHHQKLQQQAKLRDLMPIVMPPTMEPRAAQRRFFLRYGVDIVQARLLGAKETEELNQQLLDSITRSK